MIEQLNMVKLDLTDRMEATILQRAANLTKAEKNILVPLVDMSSTAQGITLKMKDALKQIGFRKRAETKKKEEVVLYQYEMYQGEEDDQEDVLYGDGYQRRGFRRYYDQGYQGNQGFQGNPGNQQGFRPQSGNRQGITQPCQGFQQH